MSVDTKQQNWTMADRISCGFLVLMLLATLTYIYTVEKAVVSQGWWLKLSIAAPWTFCLLTGAVLYAHVRRKEVSERIAEYVIGTLAIILMFTYDAMFELAKFDH